MKKKKTDYYLLRKKSLSEGDLFVTDYLKLKRDFEKQKLIIDMLSERVSRLESLNSKKLKLLELDKNQK